MVQIYLNEYAKDLEGIAKEEYLAARMMYLNFSLRPARILSHQSIEKLLKSLALRLQVDTTKCSHDVRHIYEICQASIDLGFPSDALKFLKTLADNYNHIRYRTRPVTITRSEIWLLDKVFISTLRYCHSMKHPKTGLPLRRSNPLKKHFESSKGTASHSSEMLRFLTAETVLGDLKDPKQIQNQFLDVSSSYSTFWDMFPVSNRPDIYKALGQYIGGFEKLRKEPDTYDTSQGITLGISVEGQEEQHVFTPKSFSHRKTGAENAPPDLAFYS